VASCSTKEADSSWHMLGTHRATAYRYPDILCNFKDTRRARPAGFTPELLAEYNSVDDCGWRYTTSIGGQPD